MEAVGSRFGAREGPMLGSSVERVGGNDGKLEGGREGTFVGSFVGIVEGCRDGTFVGSFEGISVGFVEDGIVGG